MKTIESFEEFKSLLNNMLNDENYNLIYSDKNGEHFEKNSNKKTILEILNKLKNDYGIALEIRAFNKNFDLSFKNGFGLLIEEKGEKKEIQRNNKTFIVSKIEGFGYRFEEMI